MGKKLKKIKINKSLKSILSNKPLLFFVAILILAGLFSTPQVRQYFRATGSEAASIWKLPELVKSNATVHDAYKNWIVYTTPTYGSPDSVTKINVYDLNSSSIQPVFKDIPGINPRINGNKVLYRDAGNNLSVKNFITSTYGLEWLIKPNIGSGEFYDIYNDKVVYTEKSGNSTTLYLRKLAGGFLPATSIVSKPSTLFKQVFIFPRIEGSNDEEYIIWTETTVDLKNSANSGSKAFKYSLSDGSTTELPLNLVSSGAVMAMKFDVSGDVIVAPVYSGTKTELVAYQHTTGKKQFIPGFDENSGRYSPTSIIWGSKVVYVLSRITNGKYYDDIKVFDLLDSTKNGTVYSVQKSSSTSRPVSALQITGIGWQPIITASVNLLGSSTYDLYKTAQ